MLQSLFTKEHFATLLYITLRVLPTHTYVCHKHKYQEWKQKHVTIKQDHFKTMLLCRLTKDL